jgi:hypothetical protein
MSDLDLIPENERGRVEKLSSDKYEGLLGTALCGSERVLLASPGWHVSDFLDNPNAVGDEAVLVLTNERILGVRPRKKTLTGKIKERPLLELPLTNVFNAGVHQQFDYQVVVSYNNRGVFEGHGLNLTSNNLGTPYGAIWAVTIKDAAELVGGTNNLPPGIER